MLNFLNRVIVTILLLVLIVILVPVAVTPQGVAQLAASILQQVQVDAFSLSHLIVAVVCLVSVVICLFLIGLEWRRQAVRSVVIGGTGSGATELAIGSIAQRLQEDLEELPQVRQVSPTVTTNGRRVDVRLDVQTTSDVDVPAKAIEIERVAKDSLARLGLQKFKLRAKIVCVPGTSSEPVPSSEPTPLPPGAPS
jgi:uncharacterized membrane protein